MCLLPVGVHILPVRYELVEWEVVVVKRFDLIVTCDEVSPWWGMIFAWWVWAAVRWSRSGCGVGFPRTCCSLGG